MRDFAMSTQAVEKMKVCDSRRKQKWIDAPTPIPPTPPRSPSVIPEPLLDDLLELWVGVGMDESTCKLNDISFQSAYEYLNGELSDEQPDFGGSIDLDEGNEQLLDRLISHNRFDDSPPPTNPASPREMNDQEIECHSEEEAVTLEYCVEENVEFKTEVETYEESEEEFKQEPVEVSSVEEDMEMEDWTMECDPLALETTDPLTLVKTEQITSEFSSHMFDSYFQNILTVDEKPPELLTEGDGEESEIATGPAPSMSPMINYSLQSFSNDVEIKHDCMWAGSCESDSHQDVFEELFGTSLAPRIDSFYGDDDTEDSYDMSNQSTTTTQETEEETDVDLEEEESNLEVLRNKILGDHSYAFNGYGPIHSQPTQASSQSGTQSTSSAQTPHTIPGVFDLGAKFKSASLTSANGLSISSSGSFSCSASLATSGKGTLKKSSPKLKKAVHKPKQELSPSSPVTSSSNSRNSSSSPSPFSSQHSNSSSSSSSSSTSSNSSSSSNLNNNSHHSSVNTTSINSSSNPSSNNPTKPRKAKTHNNMERMRRIDLRNSFDTLRKLVPVLSKANKCSKVEILKSATEYINGLKVMEKKILREEHALKLRHETLRNKLALLTSSAST